MTKITQEYIENWFLSDISMSEKIGIELELPLVDSVTGLSIPYYGTMGIGSFLFSVLGYFNNNRVANGTWFGKYENKLIIGLYSDNGITISLEMGGAIEYSSSPNITIYNLHQELNTIISTLVVVAKDFNFSLLSFGIFPYNTLANTNWMPKNRGAIQRSYWNAVGGEGWRIMTQVCSLQLNFDFFSSRDFTKKYLLLHKITPILVALCLNSPLAGGVLTKYLSNRMLFWKNCESARTGFAPSIFSSGTINLHDYVDWILDMPLMFQMIDGKYNEISFPPPKFKYLMNHGFSEKDFITEIDWETHLSSVFPYIRAKKWLEYRPLDTPPFVLLPGIITLCTGLIYSEKYSTRVISLLPELNSTDFYSLIDSVVTQGLTVKYGDKEIGWYAKELISLARESILLRSKMGLEDAMSVNYLDELDKLIVLRTTPAEELKKEFINNPSLKIPENLVKKLSIKL
jgi:glutamate--cysteine ligase